MKRKIIIAALVCAVFGAAFLGRFLRSDARFDSIIIHHSASETDNYKSIKRYHTRKRFMRDAAYHLILSNGSTEVPLGHIEPTGRYEKRIHAAAVRSVKHNASGLHLCVIGNYERRDIPASLTPAIGHAVKMLQEKFQIPDEEVLFHRDVGSTKCPGKFFTKEKMRKWVRDYSEDCSEKIKSQHVSVIDG